MSEKDIGAGRYTTDNDPSEKTQTIDEVFKKDYFTIITTVEGKDIIVKKYESGLCKITLKNLSPMTILPQIPLDIMAYYFESERTRETLLGRTSKEIFVNIEKRIENQLSKQHKKEQKKQENLFKHNDSIAKELRNTVYRMDSKEQIQDEKITEHITKIITPEVKEKPNKFGGIFGHAIKNTEQTNKHNPTSDGLPIISNAHANGKTTVWKTGKKPKVKSSIFIVPDSALNINKVEKDKVVQKHKENLNQLYKQDIEKRVGSSVHKQISTRRKNKIEFNDNVLNMP